MADAGDSKSPALYGRVGSTPTSGTILIMLSLLLVVGLLSAAPADRDYPVRTRYVEPIYPEAARDAKAGPGSVKLQAVVLKNGTLDDIEVLSVSREGVGFEEAAIAAAAAWVYKPATLNGQPVSAFITIRVDFVPGDQIFPSETRPLGAAQLLEAKLPVYPQRAITRGKEATLHVRVFVRSDGLVGDALARGYKRDRWGFLSAIQWALRDWKFPAEPPETEPPFREATYTFRFRIEDGEPKVTYERNR